MTDRSFAPLLDARPGALSPADEVGWCFLAGQPLPPLTEPLGRAIAAACAGASPDVSGLAPIDAALAALARGDVREAYDHVGGIDTSTSMGSLARTLVDGPLDGLRIAWLDVLAAHLMAPHAPGAWARLALAVLASHQRTHTFSVDHATLAAGFRQTVTDGWARDLTPSA